MHKLLKIFVFLLPVPGCGNLYAKLQGQPRIDSLLHELSKQKEDTNKTNLLNNLSYEYSFINPDEGIKYGRQALDLAIKLGSKINIGRANNNLGVNYCFGKSDYPKALEYYLEALRLYKEIGDKKHIAGVIGNIGVVYDDEGDYPKALEYYFDDLKIEEEAGDKKGVARNNQNISIVYKSQGYYPKALEYAFKALKTDEEIGNEKMIGMATGVIGTIYLLEKDYPKTLEYYFKSLKIDEETGDKKALATDNGNLGIVYAYQNDYPKALEYYLKALKTDEEIGDKDGIARATSNIGDVYTHQKNYTTAIAYEQKALKMNEETGDKNAISNNLYLIGDAYLSSVTDTAVNTGIVTQNDTLAAGKYFPAGSRAERLRIAIDYMQKSLTVAKQINAQDLMQNGYAFLSNAYKLSGDYKRSLEAYENYTAIKDSVFSKENNKKIMQQAMQYDYQKKTDSTKAQQDIRDAVAAKELQKQKLVRDGFVGGFAIVLLFASVFFGQRNKISQGKKKSDELLLNILPAEVAEELKEKGSAEAKLIDEVTVLFTDFKGFTQLSEKLSPTALVAEINDCFSAFDLIMQKYGVEKIKTIGDAYMAAGGLPTPNKTHPDDVINAALDIQKYMADHKIRKEAAGQLYFEIRIGVHTGPVVAGIVGIKKFQYDIWGDTVNTASRMESSGAVGKVNVSGATYELVKDKFACEYRGELEAKNKGKMSMYFVSR